MEPGSRVELPPRGADLSLLSSNPETDTPSRWLTFNSTPNGNTTPGTAFGSPFWGSLVNPTAGVVGSNGGASTAGGGNQSAGGGHSAHNNKQSPKAYSPSKEFNPFELSFFPKHNEHLLGSSFNDGKHQQYQDKRRGSGVGVVTDDGSNNKEALSSSVSSGLKRPFSDAQTPGLTDAPSASPSVSLSGSNDSVPTTTVRGGPAGTDDTSSGNGGQGPMPTWKRPKLDETTSFQQQSNSDASSAYAPSPSNTLNVNPSPDSGSPASSLIPTPSLQSSILFPSGNSNNASALFSAVGIVPSAGVVNQGAKMSITAEQAEINKLGAASAPGTVHVLPLQGQVQQQQQHAPYGHAHSGSIGQQTVPTPLSANFNNTSHQQHNSVYGYPGYMPPQQQQPQHPGHVHPHLHQQQQPQYAQQQQQPQQVILPPKTLQQAQAQQQQHRTNSPTNPPRATRQASLEVSQQQSPVLSSQAIPYANGRGPTGSSISLSNVSGGNNGSANRPSRSTRNSLSNANLNNNNNRNRRASTAASEALVKEEDMDTSISSSTASAPLAAVMPATATATNKSKKGGNNKTRGGSQTRQNERGNSQGASHHAGGAGGGGGSKKGTAANYNSTANSAPTTSNDLSGGYSAGMYGNPYGGAGGGDANGAGGDGGDGGDDDEDDEHKRKAFLERNRQAACRSRQKKKEWINNLETHAARLQSENQSLASEIDTLRKELFALRHTLSFHERAGCAAGPGAVLAAVQPAPLQQQQQQQQPQQQQQAPIPPPASLPIQPLQQQQQRPEWGRQQQQQQPAHPGMIPHQQGATFQPNNMGQQQQQHHMQASQHQQQAPNIMQTHPSPQDPSLHHSQQHQTQQQQQQEQQQQHISRPASAHIQTQPQPLNISTGPTLAPSALQGLSHRVPSGQDGQMAPQQQQQQRFPSKLNLSPSSLQPHMHMIGLSVHNNPLPSHGDQLGTSLDINRPGSAGATFGLATPNFADLFNGAMGKLGGSGNTPAFGAGLLFTPGGIMSSGGILGGGGIFGTNNNASGYNTSPNLPNTFGLSMQDIPIRPASAPPTPSPALDNRLTAPTQDYFSAKNLSSHMATSAAFADFLAAYPVNGLQGNNLDSVLA